jgi:hypothetical protein
MIGQLHHHPSALSRILIGSRRGADCKLVATDKGSTSLSTLVFIFFFCIETSGGGRGRLVERLNRSTPVRKTISDQQSEPQKDLGVVGEGLELLQGATACRQIGMQ